MLSIVLWTVGVIWGASAMGTIVLFGLDERSYRRSHPTQIAKPEPVAAPPTVVPTSQLATIAAG